MLMNFTANEPISLNAKFRGAERGFTIVELIIVILILAIGTALALPTWRNIVEKRYLVSGAEQIASFISFAQSEAIKRNEEVTVSWWASGSSHTKTWCFGATLGTNACDCKETNTAESDFCAIDGLAYTLSQPDFVDMDFDFLHFRSGLVASSFAFDPVRGVVINNEDALFTNPYLLYLHNDLKLSNGKRLYELQISMNITGRVKICADDDRHSIIGGYPIC